MVTTLVTVDDWQWLDRASASVIEYCLRRLPAGIGLLIAERNGSPASWHRLFDSLSDSYRHGLWQIGPLGRNHIERLIRDRLGNEVRSSLLSRACEASGGNPFYAIELARDLPRNRSNGSSLVLPPSLAELVHDQFDGLDAGIKELLLAVAMLAHPTIPRLLQALGSDVAAQVATAEDRNILVVVGDRVAFTHPLLAHAAHVIATPSSRRAMHQRLSRLVTDPEERARHLAEGGVLPEALSALEEAARRARARGAPEVAAELTERALELGADRSYLVRAAELFYDAGRSIEAEALLEEAVATLEAGRYRAEALLLLSEIRYTDDSFPEAQRLLERARSEVDGDDRLLAMIDLRRSNVSFNLGHFGLAASAARSATTSADRVAEAGLLAQSMAASVIVDLTLGCGVDEPRLRTALELEDEDLRTGAEFSPAVIGAFVYLWTDRLDESRDLLDSVCNRFADRGEEHALAWVSFIRVGLECGAGRLADALAAAETACTRLNLLDTTNAAALSLTARGQVAAFVGDVEGARRECNEALALFARSSWTSWSAYPRVALGFLELSLNEFAAAVDILDPLISLALDSGLPEPAPAGMHFCGDAAEALIGLGQLEQAETLVDFLEKRGASLTRPWATAVGSRCRGLLLVAKGDPDGGQRKLEESLAVHSGLSMPIEQARTLLCLGRLRRKLRQRRAASEVLEQARSIFEIAGSMRWADQASTEIACLGLHPAPSDGLTPAEERTARLAASGLTIREVAAQLFVSPKTVEAQVSRVYRKLGIRSRAELGAVMAQRQPGSAAHGRGI